jgi:hypothetical protein
MACIVISALPLPAQTRSPSYVRVVAREADRRVDVTVGGKRFTSYIYPRSLKKPVLFPFRAANGAVVTRGFPLEPQPGERVDHPHQVGLWFTYGNVSGLDFWNNSTAIPDSAAPHMGAIVHRAIRGVTSGEGQGTLEVTMDWVNHRGHALLREDTRFVFRAHEGYRSVERITTLTALDSAVSFTDNKEGLIGLRVARALEQPSTTPEKFVDGSGRVTKVPVLDNTGVTGKYVSSEGKEGDAVWGTRGRWTLLQGAVGELPVTLALFDHPSNVGFPTYWHARGYGLFAANNLGQSAMSNGTQSLNFVLAPGKRVTFRHQLVILDGFLGPVEMEQYYALFTK